MIIKKSIIGNNKRTPEFCFVCGGVYDRETGKGIRHRVFDWLASLIDYYFLVMDYFFDLPDRYKERALRKKQMVRIKDVGDTYVREE